MLLCLLACILCLSGVSVFADGFAVVVDNVDAVPGETVTINLSLENNTGILAARFQLTYDQTRLELVGATDKRLLPGGIFSKSYDTYPYILLWNSASPNNITDDGPLAELQFKVLETAPAGNAFVNLTYQADDVYDVDLNNVSLTVKNGTIGILGGMEPPAKTPSPTDAPSTGTAISGGGGGIVKPTATTRPLVTPAPTNAPQEKPESVFLFADVTPTDWYYHAVQFAFQKGITSGVSETSFAPEDTVTRGQFITMLCRAFHIPEMAGDNFADCGNTWYTGYLAAAKQLDISGGIGDNRFAPETAITREEMVTLIYNYLKNKVATVTTETVTFQDDALISNWAKDAVRFAAHRGYIRGKDNQCFDPQGNATRAELAQIFLNMLQ